MKLLGVLPLVVLVLLGAAAPAHAGTYTVTSCAPGDGVFYPNEAWTVSKVGGVSVKGTCTGTKDFLTVQVDPGGPAVTHGDVAALTFAVPPGLQIADWTIRRGWTLKGTPPDGYNKPFLLYTLDGQPFAGAGHYFDGQRQALINAQAWESPPEGDVDADGLITKQTWPQTSAKLGGGQALQARIGCTGSKDCKPGPQGLAANVVKGSIVTIRDDVAPTVSVAQTGLFAPGGHSGNDPITVSASDASGVALVEVLEQGSAPGTDTVANSVSYDDGAGEPGVPVTPLSCVPYRVHACPDITGQAVDPQLSAVGTYPVRVRVTDRAGVQTVSDPVTVNVTEAAEPTEPEDRGPVNGTNATDGAVMVGGFGKKLKAKVKRSAKFGTRAPVAGRLVNNAGVGIAGATLTISTKDKYGYGYEPRGTIKTGPKGGFAVRLRTQASRTVLISYKAYAYDLKAAARVALKLDVRAAATLRAPSSARRGRAFRVRGQVQGADPRKGVRVIVQVKRGKGWRIVGRGRAGKAGRYLIGARIGRSGTAKLRVQVRGRSDWPYAPGSTRTVRLRVR